MASTTPMNRSSSDDIIDTTPFLSSTSSVSRDESTTRRSVRRQSLREAARFLRRASSRRMMREPSMLVRETAAEQLEERQSDWAYSKPVVILDIVWNFAFVAVALGVLVLSRNEWPKMPLRLWIIGYALQCLLHMVCVCVEYRRRRMRQSVEYRPFNAEEERVLSPGSRVDSEQYMSLAHLEEDGGRWPSIGSWFPSALLEGASREDIDQLSKFKFRKFDGNEKSAVDDQGPVGGIMTECGTDSPMENVLSRDDAECCICLSAYDDGVELRELPCGHHFHCACVDKWLYINATCPLCKYNILKSSSHEEV
ncbi:E3 ubiquitin-protein ligase At1g12760-like isoform X4 [Durio zibethinus]|uniref:RING-type E3 ubiquitin transferase n=1 Tax=Durio zibethinus TaxID=66656 RepID=A0A6P5WVH5_DURZI|nr:E3 ubiquitin-protein ligase At1g12760-like isoform X4 [Durio zibethinus]